MRRYNYYNTITPYYSSMSTKWYFFVEVVAVDALARRCIASDMVVIHSQLGVPGEDNFAHKALNNVPIIVTMRLNDDTIFEAGRRCDDIIDLMSVEIIGFRSRMKSRNSNFRYGLEPNEDCYNFWRFIDFFS